MSDSSQVRRIKCPHCGWITRIPVQAIADASVTDVTRGPAENIQALAARLKALMDDPGLDEANAWTDYKCPNCRNVYQYNARSSETRQ